MNTQRAMKANELVAIFAKMMQIDVPVVASVIGNIPKANLVAWLSGKKDNMRYDSVLRLLQLIGLRVVGGGLRLDPDRVHFWDVRDGILTKDAYEPIRAISRLLEDCLVVEVVPAKQSWLAQKRRQVFLIGSDKVKVVVTVRKSFFKKSRIDPQTIRGTEWLDTEALGIVQKHGEHRISAPPSKWEQIRQRDLALHEFDQILYVSEPKMAWNDVALLAREYQVTADTIHEMMVERFGKGPRPSTSRVQNAATAKGAMDLHGGDRNVIQLAQEPRYGAAARVA